MTADAISTAADLTKSDSDMRIFACRAQREIFDRLLGRPAVTVDTSRKWTSASEQFAVQVLPACPAVFSA